MNVPIKQTDVEQALGEQIDRWADSHKDLPAILAGMRDTAVQGLKNNGLPNRRVEAWKYTDLRKLMRDAFPPIDETAAGKVAVEADKATFHALPGTKLVFANGVLRRDLSDLDSLPDGITIQPLADALGETPDLLLATAAREGNSRDNAIGDLVAAFAGSGLVVRVAADTAIGEPLHLVHINAPDSPFASYRHILFVLEEKASLSIMESHQGEGAYQSCGVLGFDLREGATLDHVKHQAESHDAQHLARMGIRLEAKAACRSFTLSTGGNLSRSEANVQITGSDAYLHVSGATLMHDKQHCDTTIVVDHAVPDCVSEQTFKYVMDDNAKGVFQGKVIVQPGAHGTDGRQSCNALLLSDKADMFAKPELEIFNDDVQCAHGATTGELDEDLLFYLRARGIPEVEARALLVQAFVGAALETARDDAAREAVTAAVETWLNKAMRS